MLVNREVILAAVETVYNVDAAPTAAANAILIEAPSWGNEGVKMVERPAVRASIGKLKQLYAGGLMTVTFGVEIKGSGTLGVAPELGMLLRGCGVAETVVGGTSVTYGPASTGHEQLTLYYFQDGTLRKLTGVRGNPVFNLAAGGKGMIEFTFKGHTKIGGTAQAGALGSITLPANFPAVDGTFNGQLITITSGTGAGQTRIGNVYTGATRVLTVTANWTTTPDATSVFSLDNGPIDRAMVTPTYDSTVPVPLIALPFSVGGFGAVIAKLGLDLGNEVGGPESITSPDGYSEIRITSRDPNGSFDPEATLVATRDFEGDFKSGAALAVDTGVIGATAGNRWRLQMPAISYREVSPGDRTGVRTYEIGYGAAESTTDNEFSLTFT